MPLNASVLADAIVSGLEGAGFVSNDVSQFAALAEVIATAVVDHIQMGTVTVTVTGSSASGGPVTGTGVGTMS